MTYYLIRVNEWFELTNELGQQAAVWPIEHTSPSDAEKCAIAIANSDGAALIVDL